MVASSTPKDSFLRIGGLVAKGLLVLNLARVELAHPTYAGIVRIAASRLSVREQAGRGWVFA